MYEQHWRQIKDYPNYYVSNLGEVKNILTGKILKPVQNRQRGGKYAYKTVFISKGSVATRSRKKVSRLVAQMFIENPYNKPEVNHIDFDPQNNRVENLEWCTHEENIQHSFDAGRYSWSNFLTRKEREKRDLEYLEISERFKKGLYKY